MAVGLTYVHGRDRDRRRMQRASITLGETLLLLTSAVTILAIALTYIGRVRAEAWRGASTAPLLNLNEAPDVGAIEASLAAVFSYPADRQFAAKTVAEFLRVDGTSGAVQNVATLIKAGFVVFLAVLPFIALRSEPVEQGPLFPGTLDGPMVLGIGAAVAAIMWAYDGWGNVTVVAEELVDVLVPGDHGSTFAGGPLACRAALVFLREIEEQGLLERVRARGEQLDAGLAELAREFPNIVELRGRGLIRGVRLARGADELQKELYRRRLITNKTGGDVLRLLPPFVIEPQEIAQGLAILREGLRAI